MPASSAFLDFLLDQLQPLGPVATRRMFGCTGLFQHGRMFAVVTPAGRVYMKADAANLEHFTRQECQPFIYRSRGKDVTLGYYEPPETVLDDQDDLLHWAQLGLAAAARAAQTTPR